MDNYDVIIVGGGPAGLFAAMELSRTHGLRVLLLEKGKDIDKRICLALEEGGTCPPCSPCHLVSGLGGAGAFSDGKLTLSSQVGGRLPEYLDAGELEGFINYVDGVYRRFGASGAMYGQGEKVEDIRRRAALADLRLIPVPIRHMGTECSRQILRDMRDFLSPLVEIRLGTPVKAILTDGGRVSGVETRSGKKVGCRYLIVAPGREGADWLVHEAHRLGLTLSSNPIDVGVRVEVPAPVLNELTSVLYESKLEFFSKTFDDRVRTFCMCPSGEVTMESTCGADSVTTVNGHSYAGRKTANTNFALMVSTTFTEPFHEPIAYGRYLARLANLVSGGVLVQRLGDFLEGRRTTQARLERGLVEPTLKSATPGDMSTVMPYRFLKDIVEMLFALDELAPGVASRHTLLYGVEVKFYSSRLQLSPNLETQIENMFGIGDGAGVSRGLVQASACGVVAAREVLHRLKVPVPTLP